MSNQFYRNQSAMNYKEYILKFDECPKIRLRPQQQEFKDDIISLNGDLVQHQRPCSRSTPTQLSNRFIDGKVNSNLPINQKQNDRIPEDSEEEDTNVEEDTEEYKIDKVKQNNFKQKQVIDTYGSLKDVLSADMCNGTIMEHIIRKRNSTLKQQMEYQQNKQ